MSQNHEVLTLSEVAKYLRLPPKIVQQKVEIGEIPGQRIGQSWRFSKAVLEGWLRGPSSRFAISKMVDEFKNDKIFVPMLERAYQERKRSRKSK